MMASYQGAQIPCLAAFHPHHSPFTRNTDQCPILIANLLVRIAAARSLSQPYPRLTSTGCDTLHTRTVVHIPSHLSSSNSIFSGSVISCMSKQLLNF